MTTRKVLLLMVALAAALTDCGGDGSGLTSSSTPPVNGPAWPTFAHNAQHDAIAGIVTKSLSRILWQTPVDLAPQYYNGGAYLLTHYGSPVISSANTVLVPVKTASSGSFRIDARKGSDGSLLWSASSDYIVPAHNWFPTFNVTLTSTGRMYAPGAGGQVLYRDNVDSTTGSVQSIVFYGASTYVANKTQLDATVMISTPLTVDAAGTVYFGYVVTGTNPAGLASGVARIDSSGNSVWRAAATVANDNSIDHVAMNSAPALSADGATVYIAVSDPQGHGYLLALDSATLNPRAHVALLDPASGSPAFITTDSTAAPTVGPDGDVYFGVLESTRPAHNSRGWLLHFNADLSQTKIPGGFGWDDTASVVPAAAAPTYTGTSTYLLATKYNNYAGSGSGNGQNMMAVLDPAHAQTDPISGIQIMAEVLTILGPTPDTDHPGGVREWCVNTAAVDPATHSILVNNEDGKIYRWNLATNTLTESLRFNNGLGESYTPTAVGPDGTVYAINNAVLFAVGS